jgi:hypothetical protein
MVVAAAQALIFRALNAMIADIISVGTLTDDRVTIAR